MSGVSGLIRITYAGKSGSCARRDFRARPATHHGAGEHGNGQSYHIRKGFLNFSPAITGSDGAKFQHPPEINRVTGKPLITRICHPFGQHLLSSRTWTSVTTSSEEIRLCLSHSPRSLFYDNHSHAPRAHDRSSSGFPCCFQHQSVGAVKTGHQLQSSAYYAAAQCDAGRFDARGSCFEPGPGRVSPEWRKITLGNFLAERRRAKGANCSRIASQSSICSAESD